MPDEAAISKMFALAEKLHAVATGSVMAGDPPEILANAYSIALGGMMSGMTDDKAHRTVILTDIARSALAWSDLHDTQPKIDMSTFHNA